MRTQRVIRNLLVVTRPVARRRGIISPDPSPVFLGGGTVDPKIEFRCGSCATVLFIGESVSQLRDVLVHCDQCHAYNDTET
jgi:hypothetical protein